MADEDVPLNNVEGTEEEDENGKSEMELEINRNDACMSFLLYL